MRYCDINCDMGECIGNDYLIMPLISSANIACGYHAGDTKTMEETIQLANKYKVHIGAHPSFSDRSNFGRTEMSIEPQEVYRIIIEQLSLINEMARKNNTSLHHVKPHGALYNMAARQITLAKVICRAIKDFDDSLKLYGLSGSYLISEGKRLGLNTMSEVFADRTYQDDGTLTPRNLPNALITDTDTATAQALTMINKGFVISTSGKKISIEAETICIHGDGAHALQFAKAIRNALNG